MKSLLASVGLLRVVQEVLVLAMVADSYSASQPYVAPLLLEPLILVGAALALLAMVACSKWITQGRIMPGTYRKFTFKYNRRSFTAAVQVIQFLKPLAYTRPGAMSQLLL